MLALLALRHVAPEREAAREHGRDEQQAAPRVAVDQHDAGEPEAGRRERTDERDRSVCGSWGAESRFSATAITAETRMMPSRGPRPREHRHRPDARSRLTRRRERVEDEQRHAGAERQLREVERELDRALAPVDNQRRSGSDDVGGKEVRRRREEEAEREPTSDSESVCACLRKWRWTTKTSASRRRAQAPTR